MIEVTYDEILKEVLSKKNNNYRLNMNLRYKKHIKLLIGAKQIGKITDKDIDKIYKKKSFKSLAQATKKNILSDLKQVFIQAKDRDYISVLPFKLRHRIKNQDKHFYFKVGEPEKIFAIFADHLEYEENLIIKVIGTQLLYHARRKNEVYMMKWEDNYFEEDYYIVPAHIDKTRREQTYPYSIKAKEALIQLHTSYMSTPKASQYVLRHSNGKHICCIDYYFKKLIDKISLSLNEDDEAMIRRLSPHKFRNLFATNHFNNGVPLQNISLGLGHKNIAQVLTYLESNRIKIVQGYINSDFIPQKGIKRNGVDL